MGVKVEDKYIVFSDPAAKIRVKSKYRDALKAHNGNTYDKYVAENYLTIFWAKVILLCASILLGWCFCCFFVGYTKAPGGDSGYISPVTYGGYISNKNYDATIVAAPFTKMTFWAAITKHADSSLFSVKFASFKLDEFYPKLHITEDGLLLLDDKVVVSYEPFSLNKRVDPDGPRGPVCNKGPRGATSYPPGVNGKSTAVVYPSTIHPKDVYLTKMGRGSYHTTFVSHNCSIVTIGANGSVRTRQFSATKQCTFKFQKDENLVVYDTTNTPVWASKTYLGKKYSPRDLKLYLDFYGDLCIVDKRYNCIKPIL